MADELTEDAYKGGAQPDRGCADALSKAKLLGTEPSAGYANGSGAAENASVGEDAFELNEAADRSPMLFAGLQLEQLRESYWPSEGKVERETRARAEQPRASVSALALDLD